MSGTKEGAGLYDSLANELTYDQIQQMMDQLLGEESFGFADMVQSMIRNGKADTAVDLLHSFRKIVLSSFSSDRKMFVSLIAVALVGAVFSNFSKVLHGKEVAGTAFYIVYLLFFSILATSFLQIAQLAGQTMENLLAFVKVLIPAFLSVCPSRRGALQQGRIMSSRLR